MFPVCLVLLLLSLFTFTQYQEQTGIDNVKCKTCDANTYQADHKKEAVNHDNKEDDCLKCVPGLFSDSGDQGCSTCPAGKQADSTSCKNCLAGQVSSSATSLKCAECEVGHYQSKPGLPSCVECIPGEYKRSATKASIETPH